MDIKSWLQTVLIRYYKDPDRTFRDVDAVLQMYSTSLKPKLDTYTYRTGHAQLLLCLYGTVPIIYRAIPYNIPVAFWIPTEYPEYPPIPYVKPTTNMLVREGKHVDNSGLCYHPYRSQWKDDIENHTLLELIAILQHIFGNEPPVYTKVMNSTPSSNIGSPIKEHAIASMSPGISHASMPQPTIPQPQSQSPIMPPNTIENPAHSRWQVEGTAYYNLNQDMAGLTLSPSTFDPTPVSSTSSSYITKSPSVSAIASPYPPPQQAPPQQPQQHQPQPQQHQHQPHQINNIHTGTPVIENKEKELQDRLYRKVVERMQNFQMDISKEMDELLLVNRQLNDGETQIQNEIKMLQGIRQQLHDNTDILQLKSKEIDETIVNINALPDVSVDEVIAGTTVVHNQMFDLVADDNAIVDTIYYLGKALNTECIDLATFMKCTRKLAREQFMKRALLKKIAESS